MSAYLLLLLFSHFTQAFCPPGSSVQARILEWVVISFSRESSQHRDQTQVSRIVGRCFTVCSILKGIKGYGFSTSHVWL